MRHFFKLTTALAGALAAALPAAAQTAGDIAWSAEGRLEDSDGKDADERPFDEHRLRLEAGRRYALTASSDDFDPVLGLYRQGSDEPLAENDDHGGSFNSRIVFTAEAGGEHVLRVRGYSSESRGAYRLAAEALPPLPPAARLSTARPWTDRGRLEAASPDAMESPASEHRVNLEAGQRYRFSTEGAETYLELVREEDELSMASTSSASPLTHVPMETGTYVLRVRSASGDAADYRITGEQLPPLPIPPRVPPAAQAQLGWSLWQGELSDADPDNNGQHFDDWLVPMRAGETRLILVDAEGLDTMVSVLTVAGRNGDPIEQDDDSGPGTNAMLAFQATEDGDHIVRVSSFSAGATGAYRLRVSDPLTPPVSAAGESVPLHEGD